MTFDVTGTLIHSPRLAEIYSEAFERHGVEASPAEIARLFPVVWKELDCATAPGRCRFDSHPGGARKWWKRFVDRMVELLEAQQPDRFLAAELWNRFARAEAWEVYPEVADVLENLRKRGLRLGVVSNWDERLPDLLIDLELDLFDVVVHSSSIGIAKPSSGIFARTLVLLGTPPRNALHVGDSRLEDVEGAMGAGMSALLVDRSGRDGDLADLSPLPGLLKSHDGAPGG